MSDEENTGRKHVTIAVCIPTYKRHDNLHALLTSLEQQTLAPERQVPWEVVVIDNDPQGSAFGVYEHFVARDILALRYVQEKHSGLSYVRNAAIDAVKDDADFMCFMDDDQTVVPVWLDELIRVQRENSAECVCGQILSVMPPQTPKWIHAGKFFVKGAVREGETLGLISTANLMMSCAFLRRTGLRFDHRFRHTGGEDTYFFTMAIGRHGLKIIGAAGAMALEHIFPSRLTLRWILKRAFRAGGTLSQCEKLFEPSFRLYAIRAAKSMALIVRGIMMIPFGLLLGFYITAQGLSSICLGLGEASGLLGYVYSEYGAMHRKKDN